MDRPSSSDYGEDSDWTSASSGDVCHDWIASATVRVRSRCRLGRTSRSPVSVMETLLNEHPDVVRSLIANVHKQGANVPNRKSPVPPEEVSVVDPVPVVFERLRADNLTRRLQRALNALDTDRPVRRPPPRNYILDKVALLSDSSATAVDHKWYSQL